MKFDNAEECREYFADRFTEMAGRTIDESEAIEGEVLAGLKKAKKDIKDKLAIFYGRFAELDGISKETAERLLTSDEIDDFRQDLETYMDWIDAYGADPELDKALDEAALSYRISRQQALELEIDVLIEQGFHGMDEIMTKRLEEVYTDSYYQTAFEIFKGFNVGQSFSRVDTNRLKKILEHPWVDDDLNYLDRIEANKQKLKQELPKTLSQALAEGMSYTEASEKLGKVLDIPANNAAAALVTESAYFCTLAQNDMFNELGVDEYEIIATLDNVTSEICQSMDGKVFKVKDMKTGLNAPPFHPNCRTVTAPYFDDKDLEGYEDIGRAARGEDGKTYYVSSDLTYKEWAKQQGIK